MVQFDNQYRQVKLKVVYYGPALGGKTTCLQYIHRVTDPQRRTKLYALNTASDRTLFFDLLGVDLGKIRGYRLLLQLYTVPGQVHYNATRRAVLAGADGVVFVADSQRSQFAANRESVENMLENLTANGLDPGAIPLVVLYNKWDLPDLTPPAELEQALNPRRVPSFETVATTGTGILESFAAIAEASVLSVAERLGVGGQPEALNRLVANVHSVLQPLFPKGAAPMVESPVILRQAAGEGPLSQDELVGEAVQANVAMAELNTRLDRLTAELERRVGQLRAINDFGSLMAMAREPEDVTASLLERLLSELRVTTGSLMLVDDKGNLVEVLRRGLASDPMTRPDQQGRPAAEAVLGSRQPYLARLDDMETSQLINTPWLAELRTLGLVGALAVPLVAQDRALGVLTCYAAEGRGAFAEEDLEFASALSANAAVALANARAWRTLEQLNRSLEDTVAGRTRELEQALDRSRALAAELEERNQALEAANLRLRDMERLKGDLLHRIAHELNTPVTSIQAAIRILARYQELPPEKTNRFLEIITGESNRLAELIASALQAAVLRAAEAPAAREEVPLPELLKRVITPLRTEVSTRRLSLNVKVAAGLENVHGDPEQLETALRAIVRNAVDFNREEGSVTITVRPVRRDGHSYVEMRVEDTGAGISAEDLVHAGELFWQGGNVMTDKPRGMGMGLAVARRVAALHGGQVDISSTEGEGTIVSLLVAAGARLS